ncbi:hypothetical protein CVT24_004732 [Panaeolus cyanescens]|uniref:Uncharacterized protein n=1 Tax=Panaeolus cyanescens TaxID=181874 RepID=A0A409V9R3_9AGAR|nr:hypothetical protein CVT24_004732 [Panaeolus cyanescens]
MANTIQETTLSSETSGQEVKAKAVESEGGVVGDVVSNERGASSSPTLSGTATNAQSDKASISTLASVQSNVPTNRPSLVPLGSNTNSSSSSTPVAPHPKRFSAMNINKKFLEKNSTASGSQATSTPSSISKSGSPITRPAMQPTSSHPRLVTAKLTANPTTSSSTIGWSRPSSVAPSPATATSSPSSSSPLPTAATPQPSVASAPQLPHVGKVIQPQPRAAIVQLSSQQKELISNKPVWGNIKPPPTSVVRPDIEPTDFPTAAEVANVNTRKHPKPEDTKLASESAAKQARLEEADTFRGVHLDPNAHHWDEMEGDDDDFLGGVIEFGDGRQYKVEANDVSESTPVDEPSTGTQHVSKENRFVDDYDRSWPKSHSSPASSSKEVPPFNATQSKGASTSPVSPYPSHAPHDSSRVLFNERSNRLEPYNRQAQPPYPPKRPGYQDGKDIQLLQKPSTSDYNAKNRRLSGSSGSYAPLGANGSFSGDKFRDRESNARREGPPLSPRAVKDQHVDFLPDRGRKSTMGPPPVPFTSTRRPSDGGRQLPPHLSQVSPNAPPRRLPSRDTRISPSEPTAGSLPTGRIPPISPAVSHASLVLVSPKQGPAVLLPLNAPELDDARKDVMQTAAARAKQRRQQEEAEREAQKERARKKAAELEERMKAADTEKQRQKEQVSAKVRSLEEYQSRDFVEMVYFQEQEAIAVIEDAIQGVNSQKSTPQGKAQEVKPGLHRPPSLKPVIREPSAATGRKGSFSARVPPSPSVVSAASQQESWRSRAQPPAPPPQQPTSPTKPERPSTFGTAPSALDQVETIAGGETDQLEVVDFAEMDKFVHSNKDDGAGSSTTQAQPVTSTVSKPTRAVASDFFEESQALDSSAKKDDFASWRRKVSVSQDIQPVLVKDAGVPGSSPSIDKPTSPQSARPAKEQSETTSTVLQPAAATKEPLGYPENGGQIVHVSIQSNVQRTPRGQTFYNDAAMSSLDDAMSRIKGALAGMQTQDSLKSKDGPSELTSPPVRASQLNTLSPNARITNRDRWVPPALRPRKADDNEEPQEDVVTILEPPHSPLPTASEIRVRLPTSSRRLEHLPYKANAMKKFTPIRLDILSFDPPMPEMIRSRDLVVNNILFRRPYKTNFRCVVRLPRHRGTRGFMPNTPVKSTVSGFGRSAVADDATSWRKSSAIQPVKPADEGESETAPTQGLDTMSRSPPPEPVPTDVVVTSIPKSTENSPTKSESNQSVRTRSQPKMPIGSAVAFIRDSRIDVVEGDVQTSVKFIVGSELDAAPGTTTDVAKPSLPNNELETHDNATPGKSASPVAPPLDLKEHAPPVRFSVAKTDSKSSDDSTDHILVTPPNQHAAPWTKTSAGISVKDSPARGPDPEHLKAVWSQSSSKAGLHPVNSLEGIGDDLTAIPFTLQEVKSDDGATPPPPSLPSAPSRMSLHEVTKAFQQVPTSSSSSTQREAISPPLTTAPVARPTPATNSPYPYSPSPQNTMRPGYAYPSPMMNHTPPVMYSHPVSASPIPNRMQVNGQHPPYGQQMWMPIPPPPPGTQGPGGMMRPVPSPYPAQIMHYPPPGYAPQGPPAGMMGPGPQPPNVGRGRNVSVMSPAMPHAHPHPGAAMYGGSPVMLPALSQNHGYMMPPVGRGQARPENNQMPQPHSQQHPPTHVPPHGGFSHVSNSSFVRSTW